MLIISKCLSLAFTSPLSFNFIYSIAYLMCIFRCLTKGLNLMCQKDFYFCPYYPNWFLQLLMELAKKLRHSSTFQWDHSTKHDSLHITLCKLQIQFELLSEEKQQSPLLVSSRLSILRIRDKLKITCRLCSFYEVSSAKSR